MVTCSRSFRSTISACRARCAIRCWCRPAAGSQLRSTPTIRVYGRSIATCCITWKRACFKSFVTSERVRDFYGAALSERLDTDGHAKPPTIATAGTIPGARGEDSRMTDAMDQGGFRRVPLARRATIQGAGIGATLAMLGGALRPAFAADAAPFPTHPRWKFVFVNHVTTNPFFVPTQYGIQDACKLLGCSYQWTGSESSNVSQMVNAMNTAITSGADGIAVALIDETAFNVPTENALKAGIPVIAYNADSPTNKRLSYI